MPWRDLTFRETLQINIIYLERGTSAQMTPFAICFLFFPSLSIATLSSNLCLAAQKRRSLHDGQVAGNTTGQYLREKQG